MPRALRYVVSLCLLAWVLVRALGHQEGDGLEGLGSQLGAVQWSYFGLAALLQVLAVSASAARWGVLLAHEGAAQPRGWLVRHSLIGRFVGAFTPSTTGLDGYRCLAARNAVGRLAPAARALLFEKSTGLVGLALIAVLCVAGGRLDVAPGLTAAIVASVLLGSALCVWSLAYPEVIGDRVPAWLPARGRVRGLLARLEGPPIQSRSLLLAWLLGLACHGAAAASFVAAGWSMGLDIGAGTLFSLGCAIGVATLLPISIGGVGVREGVAVVLLGSVGVGALPASLVAFLGYLAGQVPAVAGGLLSLAGPGDDVQSPMPNAPTAAPALPAHAVPQN